MITDQTHESSEMVSQAIVPTAEGSALTIYELDREAYYDMLRTPSQQCLISNSSLATVYKTTEVEKGECYGVDESTFLTTDLLAFAMGNDTMKAVLQKHGIDEDIKTVSAFYTRRMPLVMWVQTETEQCFIAAVEQIDDTTGDKGYAYHVYMGQELYDQYKPVEGALYVEHQELSDSTVIMHEDYVEVPFLAVVTALGAEVTWENNETVYITYSERDYVLHLDGFSLWQDGQDSHVLDTPPGGHTVYDSENGEVWMDHYSANRALKLFSASLYCNTVLPAVSVTRNVTNEDVGTLATLIINGETVTDECHRYVNVKERYAVVPFEYILRELGAQVEHDANHVVTVRHNGKEVLFDTTCYDFSLEGLPGSTSIREMINGEMAVDADSAEDFLEYFMDANLEVDYETLTITVEIIGE